jgi:hypothetical protein
MTSRASLPLPQTEHHNIYRLVRLGNCMVDMHTFLSLKSSIRSRRSGSGLEMRRRLSAVQAKRECSPLGNLAICFGVPLPIVTAWIPVLGESSEHRCAN